MFLFDSCFSGTIFKTKALPKHPPHISHITSRPVRQFISAGSAGEEVPAKSVFTPLVIRALEGSGDVDGDGYVTGTEMGMYLHKEVLRYDTGQHPQYGKIRDPDLDEGDFVFLLASSGTVIEAPSTPLGTQGRLSVTANVSDAEVIVDGRLIGNTPLTAMALSTGSHRVQVKKKGYDTYRTDVEISAGRTASLEAWLTEQGPKTGRLYVNTEPSKARVRILNIGPVFQQGMDLAPGDYHVEVSAAGYGKQTRWVSLSAGEDKRIGFRLAGTEPAARPAPVVSPSATATGQSRITNSLDMEFVFIRPGTFMMGSPSNEPKRDKDEHQHRVTLTRGYYLQTTELTQGQWKRVMGSNPSGFKNCGDDCPVEKVSWTSAQTFIQKLNQKEGTDKYRLPTEAEWEYAARAGTKTPFSFGDCLSTDQANYDGNYPMPGCSKGRYRNKPVAVGSFPANAWGLYDMHGNVWEWCQDRHGDYPTGSVTDPNGPSSGEDRVSRGGSWGNYARYCRSAVRYGGSPDGRIYYLGFRLARTR